MLVISPFEANELIPLFSNEQTITQLNMYAASLHDKQNILLRIPKLSIPANRSPLLYCELLDAQLLVFSGSMYFTGPRAATFASNGAAAAL